MGSERRKRNEPQIMIRVTAEEKAFIQQQAAAAGMTVPVWLRAMAQSLQPKSRVNPEAVRALSKANAETARLGETLKLALSGQAPEIASSPEKMGALLKAIEATLKELHRSVLRITP